MRQEFTARILRACSAFAQLVITAFTLCDSVLAGPAAVKPFAADDLVRLERVSDPQLSPEGMRVAYQLRETDFTGNKGVNSLWLRSLQGSSVAARRLTAPGTNATTPRWSTDGNALYFLSTRSGSSQVWRLDLAGGEAQPITHSPLDIGNFMLSPDGKRLLVSMEVYLDCATLECTHKRLEERTAAKASGQVYDRLFMRHWDTWTNGTRSQLYIYDLDASTGIAAVRHDANGAPVWLTRTIDGDVPSKPFGDDGEFCFTPDSRHVIFSARIAGTTEAWSTNFDLFQVPVDGSSVPENLTAANLAWDTGPAVSPDGRTLAYRAMQRPGFEADRFGIMLRDLKTGTTRELLPLWDRSADGLQWSLDGKTLYTMADEQGQRRLFAIDVAKSEVRALTDQGTVRSFALAGHSVSGHSIVYALDTLDMPTQLFQIDTTGSHASTPVALTHHNAATLANVGFGTYEQFSFKGWKDDAVYGYVVKPVGFVAGKKYPVAFIIHGGPQGSMGNDFHYRWNPQTYAGAGFAVVFIDFHGSTGYGQAFTDAISDHWGDRPLEDLQKGWAYALAHYDFLDGANACALGASYGGYMINWIAGNWPTPASGAWKCLVSHDGLFDTRMSYYDTEELWFDEWEHGGPQYDHLEKFERFNPVNHVAKWRVPMLIVHNDLDFRVPIDQGISAFTALQRRGIPSQFLRFPDENHWVLKPQNSLQWHHTVEAWIKRWTGTPTGQ